MQELEDNRLFILKRLGILRILSIIEAFIVAFLAFVLTKDLIICIVLAVFVGILFFRLTSKTLLQKKSMLELEITRLFLRQNHAKFKSLGIKEKDFATLSSLNFNDFKLRKLKEKVDFRSEEETALYINQVLKETAKVNDPIRVELALKKLAKEFDLSYNTLEMRFRELDKPKTREKKEIIVPKKNKKKTKYEKAMEQILYFMLNHDWVISQFEKENIIYPNEESRLLASEVVYYYTKYGNINIPDFYTYVQDKEEVVNFLNEILASNYQEDTTMDELLEYFGVIREYSRTQEIKRLTKNLSLEVDPVEQAKIAEKIRKLRIGDNKNGWRN